MSNIKSNLSLINIVNITNVEYLFQSEAMFTKVLFAILTNGSFYYLTPFIVIGLVCNGIILFVFSLSSARQEAIKSAHVYYIVMAVGEIGTLIFKDLWFFDFGIGIPKVFHVNPIGIFNVHMYPSDFLCPMLWLMWYAHEATSNIAFIAFDLERVVALYFPLKTLYFFNARKAIIGIVVVVVISTISSATFFEIAKFHSVPQMPTGTFCSFASKMGAWSFVPVIAFVTSYILPSISDIICTILISSKIYQQIKFRKSLRLNANKTATGNEGSVWSLLPLSRREISVRMSFY